MTEILVFGATGQAGGAVVRSLVAGGEQPRVFVRDPKRARALFADTVSIVSGDFEDAGSIARALEGVSSLFLASPLDPRQRDWQGRVVEAAKTAGPLIVKLSGLATTPGSFVDSGRWHAETESLIEQSGLDWVFLRPLFFMQNLARSVPAALSSGVLPSSAETARIAMVDVGDIGEVAARLLTGAADRTGRRLTLTSSEAVTYREIAAMLSALSGREIRVGERPEDELRRSLERAGMPTWHQDILLQFNRAFREGLAGRVTGDVADVLGRSPRTLRDYLREIS